jgi:hypothetical protein
MRKYLFFVFISQILYSCSHSASYTDYQKDLKDKEFWKDPITVYTAVRLAHAAYLKSCVINSQFEFKQCKLLADKHVKEDILDLFNQ